MHKVLPTERAAPDPALRLAAIIESSDDAIVAKDLDGVITDWNKAAERMFGYTAAEAIGQSVLMLIPEDRRAEEDMILSRLRAGQRIRHFETVRRRKDGGEFPVSLSITPIMDARGRVIGASKIARDISDRSKADEAAYRLAAIVESSDDAIIAKNLVGFITSWNEGAQRIFGYTAEEAVGQHVTLLIPEDRRHEEDHILGRIRAGERVHHFETVRRHKDGHLIDVSLTISPIRTRDGRIVGASKIARDISATKAAAATIAKLKERYETLNDIAKVLSSDLDLERVVGVTIDAATRLTGAKFGAFFYNVIDDKGESYLLYALSGAPREAFAHIGMPRNTAVFNHTFAGLGGALRSDDIRKDPRYGQNPPHNGMPEGHLPVVSYLSVPVIGRDGKVIGGLFFAHDQPAKFDQEAEAIALGIASHAAIAIDNAHAHRASAEEIKRRTAAEETKELLLHEIKHRVKNMLATIDAVAAQTLRDVPPAVAEGFSARVRALAGAHDLLTDHDWREIDLVAIAHKSLAPFKAVDGVRLSIDGPHVALDANKSLLLALAFHELATNSIKYGAWSGETGKVDVSWRRSADDQVDMVWTESGGPPVSPPTRKGFGSTLIQRALTRGGGAASLEFPAAGAVCRIQIPV